MGNFIKALRGMSFPLFIELAKWRLIGTPKTYEELFSWEERHNFAHTLLRARWKHAYDFSLVSPSSFNEKLIHRRLFSRDPIWPLVTDKIGLRDWVKRAGYSDLVAFPKVYGIYEKPEQIPPEIFGRPFVLKCAWASGYNFFLDDTSMRESDVRSRLEKWSREPYGTTKLIWASHRIPRRFIVEEKLTDARNSIPPDFKFFVFHGKVEFCQIDIDRFGDHSRVILNASGETMPFSYKTKNYPGNFAFDDRKYAEMVKIAERLGEHFDFIRVDLYLVNGKPLLGELTQTPESGFGVISPYSWDFELGTKWRYDPSKPSYSAAFEGGVGD